MPRIDAFLKLGSSTGMLGRPSRRWRTADVAHEWRPDAHQVSRTLRHRARKLYDGNSDQELSKRSNFTPGAIWISPTSAKKAAASASTSSARTPASAPCFGTSRTKSRRWSAECCRRLLQDFCDYHQGMVLVTGSTGTGKSTTLGGDDRSPEPNPQPQYHQPRRPDRVRASEQEVQVIQRELGTHLDQLCGRRALSHARRPGCGLVGELRDAETISMAMTAAETGHLVLGTLHTTGATKTIDR